MGNRIVALVIALSLGLFLLPAAASAQSSIAGVVKDTSGAVLPGVQVDVRSPALIEQVRTAITDSQGVFRVIDLRPGTYTVTFTLQGFSTFERSGVELPASFTATVNAEMKLGSISETITVSGEAPLVDVHTATQSQQTIPSEVRNAIPLSSNAAAFAALIPAATQVASDRDVGGIRGENSQAFSIHGSHTADMIMLRDGLDYDQFFSGGNKASSMNPAAVAETTVQTASSAAAESGGVQINAIPREGGNTFHGTFQSNYANAKLQSDNLDAALHARGATAGSDIKTLYDVEGGIGGPIRENKLWFFVSLRRWITTSNLAGLYFNKLQNPQGTLLYAQDLSRPGYEDNFYIDESLRLTWQASAKHKINMLFSNEDNCQCHQGQRAGTLAPEAAGDNHFAPAPRAQVKWTFPVTSRLLFDAGSSALWGKVVRRPTGGTDADYVITDLDRNFTYGHHARDYANPPSTGGNLPYAVVTQTANMSYVTGSRTTTAGISFRQAYQQRNHFINHSLTYTFRGATPAQLTEWISPFHSETRQHAAGLYVQQQWTTGKLTLDGGLRYDYFRGFIPAMTLPGGRFLPQGASFPAVDNALNYKDLSPRVGVAFDLFGNGRTAVKASLGRYVNIISNQDVNFRNQAPVLQMVTNTARNWNDVNGNYVPDCDLANLNANGECEAVANRNFGTTVPGTTYDNDVTHGFGNRGYNWQGSAGVAHQLTRGIGVEVAYFRTSFGNFVVTDNVLVTPADFDVFSITAPQDSRLPGGGSQTVGGLYDLKPAKFGLVQNIVRNAKNFGKQTEKYNGVEMNVRGRLPRAGMLIGGLSVGRTTTNNCEVLRNLPEAAIVGTTITPLDNCSIVPPWGAGTQYRLSGVFSLPGDVRVSGTYQNIGGIPTTASYVVNNAMVAGSLGRPLSGGGNPTRTLDLIRPNSFYPEGRGNQIDFRLSRRFALSNGTRIEPQFNVFNLTNANDVVSMTTRYGAAWQNVTGVLPPRMVKVGVQVDF
ncbi:MAG TPA: carboxypeptidase regulatory-like domain-containing protein [Vicinamibacterales bacterium]|nr:carboxypeptidase regulatory-like domain-containing protein [Vicinamibacterales bacterium]